MNCVRTCGAAVLGNINPGIVHRVVGDTTVVKRCALPSHCPESTGMCEDMCKACDGSACPPWDYCGRMCYNYCHLSHLKGKSHLRSILLILSRCLIILLILSLSSMTWCMIITCLM